LIGHQPEPLSCAVHASAASHNEWKASHTIAVGTTIVTHFPSLEHKVGAPERSITLFTLFLFTISEASMSSRAAAPSEARGSARQRA
jgi:hypothetical protein